MKIASITLNNQFGSERKKGISDSLIYCLHREENYRMSLSPGRVGMASLPGATGTMARLTAGKHLDKLRRKILEVVICIFLEKSTFIKEVTVEIQENLFGS